MASFVGTNKEFHRYIGPQLRNLVQQITKPYKKKVGACESCTVTENLEAAHVNERSRLDVIDQIVARHTFDGIITVNLKTFEEEFKNAHLPIEKSVRILCKKCHKQYSQVVSTPEHRPTALVSPKKLVLPITLSPADSEDFKQELLRFKRAEIEVYYSDGRSKKHIWNASKFKKSSSVFGNLRGKKQFRGENWRQLGIQRVHVSVKKS